MGKEWRDTLISGVVSIIIATGAASLGWSYEAGQLKAELQQTKEKVVEIHDLTEQMKVMNKNITVIQTEMKYYRRDIDELRDKQDEISGRLDSIADDSDS